MPLRDSTYALSRFIKTSSSMMIFIQLWFSLQVSGLLLLVWRISVHISFWGGQIYNKTTHSFSLFSGQLYFLWSMQTPQTSFGRNITHIGPAVLYLTVALMQKGKSCENKGYHRSSEKFSASSWRQRWALGGLCSFVVKVTFVWLTAGHLGANCVFVTQLVAWVFIAILVQATTCETRN